MNKPYNLRYEYTFVAKDKVEEVTYSYCLTVSYNNKAADYVYELAHFRHHPNGEVVRGDSWTGDKAWAERHSKHYGIEMPEVNKEK